MRFRIAVALAVGIVLLGILPADLLRPPADGVFAIFSGSIGIADLLICAFLSLLAGFIASAVCTPFGLRVGIIAAPAGMAFWALKSDALSTVFQQTPAVQDRLNVYAGLRFEAFIWLAIAGCGFVGAIAADKLFRRKSVNPIDKFDSNFKLPSFSAIPIVVVATVLIGNILVNVLAGDVSYPDVKLSRVTGQPANLQLAFAVIVAFMACGFCAKLFLGTSFIWPASASALLSSYSIIAYSKKPIMEHISASWPAVFFARPVLAVLPVYMVAFGCLGAVWGYWLAVSYHLWREYES
ncbi:MAG: hypothetical protein KJ757_00895 [Planctomycetes bacterium]|nr:hypothetical protein [Planctomycetota bacterium]MBU2457186.1 hypothetical protein [Planctomycetota bacterium]MBU2596112.1 hypothetical protein [Planctomycetota bacterium]